MRPPRAWRVSPDPGRQCASAAGPEITTRGERLARAEGRRCSKAIDAQDKYTNAHNWARTGLHVVFPCGVSAHPAQDQQKPRPTSPSIYDQLLPPPPLPAQLRPHSPAAQPPRHPPSITRRLPPPPPAPPTYVHTNMYTQTPPRPPLLPSSRPPPLLPPRPPPAPPPHQVLLPGRQCPQQLLHLGQPLAQAAVGRHVLVVVRSHVSLHKQRDRERVCVSENVKVLRCVLLRPTGFGRFALSVCLLPLFTPLLPNPLPLSPPLPYSPLQLQG